MTTWRLKRVGESLVLEDSDAGGGNYMRALKDLVREYPGFKGESRLVDVCHDDSCAILQGGSCNCNPELRVWPQAKTLS